MRTPVGDFDQMGYLERIGGEAQLITRAERHRPAEHDVLFVSLDDLIRIQQHVQRPKGSDSLVELRVIKRVREEGRR